MTQWFSHMTRVETLDAARGQGLRWTRSEPFAKWPHHTTSLKSPSHWGASQASNEVFAKGRNKPSRKCQPPVFSGRSPMRDWRLMDKFTRTSRMPGHERQKQRTTREFFPLGLSALSRSKGLHVQEKCERPMVVVTIIIWIYIYMYVRTYIRTYVCTYVCMYVYIYIYICIMYIYVYIFTCVYVYIYVYVHNIFMYMYMYIHICICKYVNIYICIYIYIMYIYILCVYIYYVCIYIYIHIYICPLISPTGPPNKYEYDMNPSISTLWHCRDLFAMWHGSLIAPSWWSAGHRQTPEARIKRFSWVGLGRGVVQPSNESRKENNISNGVVWSKPSSTTIINNPHSHHQQSSTSLINITEPPSATINNNPSCCSLVDRQESVETRP